MQDGSDLRRRPGFYKKPKDIDRAAPSGLLMGPQIVAVHGVGFGAIGGECSPPF